MNIDSIDEAEYIELLADKSDVVFNVGIRCNYDVKDGVVSRFGFDTEGEDFKKVLDIVINNEKLHFVNFQCHFAKRQVEYWPARAKGMVELIDRLGIIPERIDIGGGLFGKMSDELKKQFTSDIPQYKDYAKAAATVFCRIFQRQGR